MQLFQTLPMYPRGIRNWHTRRSKNMTSGFQNLEGNRVQQVIDLMREILYG